MYVDRTRTYIGVVEENEDPKKLGRCRVRVIDIFDDIPKDDIPWASPWKDLNGNEFNVPDKGKILTVVFDSGNIYKPEYIYAEHYNINLENKLQNLSNDDYLSMKSLFFDHSTQIYRNTSEGLRLDHEYTNINLDKNGNILLNLRDNKSIITLGSKDSDEEAVLGTTFMEWFDTFIDNLLGTNSGPYIGNLGSPVVANPDFISCIQDYKARRQKFVSEHVRLPKNKNILTQDREYINQKGDTWKSTKSDNKLTSTAGPEYKPSSKIIDDDGKESDYKPIAAASADNPAEFKPADHSQAVSYDIPTASLDKSKYENGKLPESILVKSLWLNGDKKTKWIKSNVAKTSAAKLTSEAAKAFDAMFDLYDSSNFDGKAPLTITDGYRTYEDQVAVKKKYGDSAASPGKSNHGWGLAVDLSGLGNPIGTKSTRASYKDAVFRTPTYQWLYINGPKFGIISPFSLRDGSNLEEWWHFEYQGNASKTQKPQFANYAKAFSQADAKLLRSKGINFTPPNNLT